MSREKGLNIHRLLAEHNLNIDLEGVPANLKCGKCKSVLENAYQVSCGCTFCRICIDDMTASGTQFCPGDSGDCGDTALATAAPDYRANKNISQLTVKCSNDGCLHECQLINIEEHLQECPRTSVECPFYELGCKQDRLVTEEMDEHLQQENRSHYEILIGMIDNMNNELAGNKREVEQLKNALFLKDEQLKIVLDENKSIRDEIQLIRDKNKLINDNFKSIKVLTGLEPIDARYDWLLDADVIKESWGWGERLGRYFTGVAHSFKYRLDSWNGGKSISNSLWIDFSIYAGSNDSQLQWPFQGTVVITVADKVQGDLRQSISKHCIIQRPLLNVRSRNNDPFLFPHHLLVGAGLDLSQGLRVSCQIVPDSPFDFGSLSIC